jgi:hypothetical protein
MTTTTQKQVDPGFTLQPLLPSELAGTLHLQQSWLWHGYLAHSKLTALVSPPKSGKTTLLSYLLSRMNGGGQLAGRAIAPGRALVVSEESAADWDARCQRLRLETNVQFVCRPFRRARPTDAEWFAFIDGLSSLHQKTRFDLIVIDALAALLPGYAESCGPKLLDCLLPLQALAQDGPAVWLLHHPAKGKRADGQASRGSGALNGFTDINMELSHIRRARSLDRRRRLCAYSRYLETPRHQILELMADGSDYVVCTTDAGIPLAKPWQPVMDILSSASDKYTQEKILFWWPEELEKPHRTTLARWLKRAVEQKLICSSGAGQMSDPYVFWLADREPFLHPGPGASEEEIAAWRTRVSEDSQRKLLACFGISSEKTGPVDPSSGAA